MRSGWVCVGNGQAPSAVPSLRLSSRIKNKIKIKIKRVDKIKNDSHVLTEASHYHRGKHMTHHLAPHAALQLSLDWI